MCLNSIAQAVFVSGKTSAYPNINVVEVIVRCEVVGHVAEDHSIFKYREDGVHPRLTVGVVSPVAVHCDEDGKKIGHQQYPLVIQRLTIKEGTG